jgi:hypothetical protein
MEADEHGLLRRNLTIDGYSDEDVAAHAYLMDQAGLIVAVETTHMRSSSRTAIPRSITWYGYEFLEAARNQSIWEKAKAKARHAGVPFLFDILKQLAVEMAHKALQ